MTTHIWFVLVKEKIDRIINEYSEITGDYGLLKTIPSTLDQDGLFLEFGVATGRTINLIAKYCPNVTVYGFDSFKGLPERWRTVNAGFFAQEKLPQVEQNVQLIEGLFQETLDHFLQIKGTKISLCHIDCDLYSSTSYVLQKLKPYFVDGSIIIFDEFALYDTYEQHEYRAFNEFLESTGFDVEYIGKNHKESYAFKLVRK